MPTTQLTFSQATAADYPQIVALVKKVFDATVGVNYTPQGREAFYRHIELDAFTKRQTGDCLTFVAKDGEKVIGMLELKNYQQLSLFYVDQAYQHQGIGRHLLADAVAAGQAHNPQLKELAVKTSIFACPIYQGLGFTMTGESEEQNGVQFTKMTKTL